MLSEPNIGAVSRDGSRVLLVAGDENDEIKPQILTDGTVLSAERTSDC